MFPVWLWIRDYLSWKNSHYTIDVNSISNYHIKVLSSSYVRKENLSKRRPWELNLTENKNNEWYEDENRKRSVNTCLSSDKLYKLCYRFIFTLLLSKRLAVHKDSKMSFSPTSIQWYCYKKTTVMAWRAWADSLASIIIPKPGLQQFVKFIFSNLY